MRPIAGGPQAFTQLFEYGAIRLGAVACSGQQLRRGLLHRQIGRQFVDIAQVQVRRHPARQQQYFTGNAGRDIGIAITVAAHPGSKADRCGLKRQMQAGRGMQSFVSLTQHMRHGVP